MKTAREVIASCLQWSVVPADAQGIIDTLERAGFIIVPFDEFYGKPEVPDELSPGDLVAEAKTLIEQAPPGDTPWHKRAKDWADGSAVKNNIGEET